MDLLTGAEVPLLWLVFRFSFRAVARNHITYGLSVSLGFLAVIPGLFRSLNSSEFLPPGLSPVESDHWDASHYCHIMG